MTLKTFAAIDLGSNSFHLAIGQVNAGELKWKHKMSEKVQLAAGIDSQGRLDEQTAQRAIECLQRFKERVATVPSEQIRIVGTNAFRTIQGHTEFIREIELLFGQRLEVVSGREEARLIYLGVSHSMPLDSEGRLVIDIGGGSTEFILGKQFQPLLTESLHMGCVSFRQRFFSNTQPFQQQLSHAVKAAEQEVQHIKKAFRSKGWQKAVGSSGSVKSIFNALAGLGSTAPVLTLADLEALVQYLIAQQSGTTFSIPNVKPERYPIFSSGLSILVGAMRQLDIKQLEYSDGALREGIIYDLLGRHEPENVRKRTLTALACRFDIDQEHSRKVQKSALYLYKGLRKIWPNISDLYLQDLLKISAKLHEIGSIISHSQFHKHGAYMLANADLAGFSRQDQAILACLVRLHRRKFSLEALNMVPENIQSKVKPLAIILRLAVVFHHSRNQDQKALGRHVRIRKAQTHSNKLVLEIDESWIELNPLVQLDLEQESKLLLKIGFELDIQINRK